MGQKIDINFVADTLNQAKTKQPDGGYGFDILIHQDMIVCLEHCVDLGDIPEAERQSVIRQAIRNVLSAGEILARVCEDRSQGSEANS